MNLQKQCKSWKPTRPFFWSNLVLFVQLFSMQVLRTLVCLSVRVNQTGQILQYRQLEIYLKCTIQKSVTLIWIVKLEQLLFFWMIWSLILYLFHLLRAFRWKMMEVVKRSRKLAKGTESKVWRLNCKVLVVNLNPISMIGEWVDSIRWNW